MPLFGSVGKWLGRKLVKLDLADVLKGVASLEELLRQHPKVSDMLKPFLISFLLRQRGRLNIELRSRLDSWGFKLSEGQAGELADLAVELLKQEVGKI